MIDSFLVTFSQICVLFIFIAIGYWAKKTGKAPQSFNKGLSNLLVYVFVPALIFGSVSENFRLDVLAEKWVLLSVSSGVLCFFLCLAFVVSRVFAKSKNSRDVYMYSFTFPNSGYIGNPLVLAVFGELVLFEFIIYCIPYLILTYTFGVYILNPNRKFSLKTLVNPILLSVVLGMIVGSLKIKLPSVANTVIGMASDCLAPAAMILTGIVFASNDLKKMVSNGKVYIACFIKLFVVPFVAVIVMWLTNLSGDIAVLTIIMMTLPTGLNSIVFPEAYGGDSRTGAQLCFVSTVFCLVAIPTFMEFYRYLCG